VFSRLKGNMTGTYGSPEVGRLGYFHISEKTMARNGRKDRRRGAGSQILLATAAVTLALPLFGWTLVEKSRSGASTAGPLTCVPVRGTFTHQIIQRGTIECTSNVEVACDVRARGFRRTNILEAVPEGTYVEPGDFLIQLDSSPLEQLKVKQLIRCAKQQAALIRTETWAETTRIRLQEYIDGLLPQDRLRMGNAVDRAKEKLRKAEQAHRFSEAMYRQGIVTAMALEADEYSAEKARIELQTAETRLDVLENYTSKKRLKDLEGDLAVAQASVRWRRHVYGLYLKELDNLNDQIAKCTITAPTAGQVVHANIHHNGHSHLIEPGAFVWRKRVLIRLPNSREMQVKAHIPEASVTRVRKGQDVHIRFEAYPGVELTGSVERIDEFPSPTPRWGPQVKCYETTISIARDSIDAADLGLRPGLTADITIHVDEQDERIMVPFQAILKHGKRSYCVTHDRRGFHAHRVRTGASNGKFVIIREGIEEGQEIVHGAAKYRKELDLSELAG
jgi:multidrug resistance efflux pump